MPRAVAVVFAVVLVVANPAAVRSQTNAPDGYTAAPTAELYSGVEYVKLTNPKVPVVAHVAHVLPGAAVDLQVVNAHDRISSAPQDLETTSSMCQRVDCIVGVNGDFHKMGVPAGAVVVDGRMLHSPEPDRPQLTVTNSGRLIAGAFEWSGSLTAGNGSPLPVSAVNAAPPANGLALFTPEHGPATDESSRVELVVKASNVGRLNRPTNLELVDLRTGAGPIPAGGAVLTGDGSAGQQLRDLWARRQAGGVRLLISSPVDARLSLGVEPVVLRDGKRASPWRDPNVINPRQPHTLVGWNKEGHVYLVAVDGRQAASEGVSMAEAADFLAGLGASDAVSLDGGGGTVFVADGSVRNRPSDNNPDRPSEYVERGATNAFVVIARPRAVLPQQAPPAQGTTSPGAVQAPGAAQEPTADGSDGPGSSSSPWFMEPTTVDGVAPGISVDAQLAAGGMPVDPSAPGSPGRRGEAATPTGAADPAEPGGSTDDGRSPVTDTRSVPKKGDDRAADDPLQAALSDASLPSTDRPTGNGGGTIPFPLAALAAVAAVGAPGSLMARAKRRSRPLGIPEEIPLVLPVEEPEVLLPADPEPAIDDISIDDISIDAFAVVLGGEGAQVWQDHPAPRIEPVVPVETVETVEPVEADEGIRLVDLRLTFGLHELVLCERTSAEGEGFEPSGLASGGFQDRTVRPLRHPSGAAGYPAR